MIESLQEQPRPRLLRRSNFRQTGKKSPTSRAQILVNPIKIFCVFPNPAPYFDQILDPENTLPDPDKTGLGLLPFRILR